MKEVLGGTMKFFEGVGGVVTGVAEGVFGAAEAVVEAAATGPGVLVVGGLVGYKYRDKIKDWFKGGKKKTEK